MLVVLALLTACNDGGSPSGPQFVAEEPFAYTVSPAAQSSFTVTGVTGGIDIVGTAPGSEVRIDGIKRTKAYSRSEAQQRLDDIRIKIEETQDVIAVMTEHPVHSSGVNYEVEYEIWVPNDLNLQVDQVTGAVVIEASRGDVHIRNVTGAVALEGVVGSVDVGVTTGSIAGSIPLGSGDSVDLSVTTGTVALSIPAATSATLKASVVTGTLSFTGLDIVDVDARESVVFCTLGEGDGAINLSSVTGGVSVAGR
jgi:DUF4097 and DUF4098 domain-containing protein YvlB